MTRTEIIAYSILGAVLIADIGIMIRLKRSCPVEPVIKCMGKSEVLRLNARRERFIDRLNYPLHVLTKKEKGQLMDSINHYNYLLTD